MTEDVESKKIEALEAEVSRLKAKLEEKDNEVKIDENLEQALSSIEIKEASKTRAILLSIGIVVGGLVLIVMMFSALSKGFSLFANKAAETLTPAVKTMTDPPSIKHQATTQKVPKENTTTKPTIAVPGL